MKYKSKELTKRKVVNNILRYHELATETEVTGGLTWYTEAHDLCVDLSERTGYPVLNIAGVVAALSPQTSWELNKVYVVRFLADKLDARANTTANKKKALACLSAGNTGDVKRILNGNKTKAFFFNIAFPEVHGIATVDRHAVAICLQRPEKVKALPPVQLTDNQYNFFEDCYNSASEKLGVNSLELQAITWVTYRRLRGLK